MTVSPSVEEVKSFLVDWKSSCLVKERFGFNSRQWSKYSRWLIKAGFVECISVRVDGHQNRVFLYRVVEGVK